MPQLLPLSMESRFLNPLTFIRIVYIYIYMVLFDQNFNFLLRRDHQKNFLWLQVYPSTCGVSVNCTCVDTFAGVHLNRSAMEAGIAANSAEERKRHKYAALAEAHQFVVLNQLQSKRWECMASPLE